MRQDESLLLKKNKTNYQRLSISIVIASGKPFGVGGRIQKHIPIRGAIIGLNAKRNNLYAEHSNLTVIDAFIGSEAYQKLSRLIGVGKARMLSEDEFCRVNDLCKSSFNHKMSMDEAAQLYHDIVNSLCVCDCEDVMATKPIDDRIKQVIDIVETYSFDELSSQFIATEVNLSESRLRSLFKQEMNCTLSSYLRHVAFWKSVPYLLQGMNYTQAAHQVGFYDLAHYSRTLKGIFGISPKEIQGYIDSTETFIR